jgi:hypothetical protein
MYFWRGARVMRFNYAQSESARYFCLAKHTHANNYDRTLLLLHAAAIIIARIQRADKFITSRLEHSFGQTSFNSGRPPVRPPLNQPPTANINYYASYTGNY